MEHVGVRKDRIDVGVGDEDRKADRGDLRRLGQRRAVGLDQGVDRGVGRIVEDLAPDGQRPQREAEQPDALRVDPAGQLPGRSGR